MLTRTQLSVIQFCRILARTENRDIESAEKLRGKPHTGASNNGLQITGWNFGRILINFAIALAVVAAFVGLAALGLLSIARKVDEGIYVRYLMGEYLQHEKKRLGHWPTSVSDVPADLMHSDDPNTAERLLKIHNESHPVLYSKTLTGVGYSGTVVFHWLLGGTHPVEFDRPP